MPGMPVVNGAQPRYPVSPMVAGVATHEVAIDADLATATDQPIIGLRIVVDPGDDVAAAQALMTGAGCRVVQPGDAITIEADAAISAVYIVGIGNAAEPADYTGGACIISLAEDDLADVAAQMVRLDFSVQDNVRSLSLQLSATWASGLAARVFVEANSHA